MIPTSDKLPVVLMLGALVFIFFFIHKQTGSRRISLWYLGWLSLFLRSVIQLWQSLLPEARSSQYGSVMALNFLALVLPAIFFWIATSMMGDSDRRRLLMFGLVGIPAAAYVVLLGYGVTAPILYAVLVVVLTVSAISIFNFYYRRLTWYVVIATAGVLTGGAWTAYRALRGQPEAAFFAFLFLIQVFCAAGYWRLYRRLSSAVISAAVGFLLWSTISPIIFFTSGTPLLTLASSGLWNVPAFLVAIGLIVTLLEEQTRVAGLARDQQRELNQQMVRFAELTSKLLSGVDVNKFCEHVAAVVAAAGSFNQVFVLLRNDQGRLTPCGHAGITPQCARFLQTQLAQVGLPELQAVCGDDCRIGPNSYHASLIAGLRSRTPQSTESADSPRSMKDFESVLPVADDETERLVPLLAPSNTYMGCIVLRKPKAGVTLQGDIRGSHYVENLSTIELLAADLAIAFENSNLQQHLLRSERLAGVGQLVSGVAHELNNPLTSVLGYTEMLIERIEDQAARRELEIVQREALRMKNIIQNLLSFSRQSKFQRTPVDLTAMLDEILSLRAYHLRSHFVKVETVLQPALPPVLVDESLMKQVFMNVLKNAEHAVEKLEDKRILIETSSQEGKVTIQFKDNGAGFSNLARAFDPFFTTKGPTEGSGLGLSTCYGIVKELGGEITAFNQQPHGGGIAIELPVLATTASPIRTPPAAPLSSP